MGESLRQSMRYLHTWSGVILGGLLFAIFWMGSLSVFDKEIDRWMIPATRLTSVEPVSLDKAIETAQQVAPKSLNWRFILPTNRAPQLRFYYYDSNGKRAFLDLDPLTAQPLPNADTLAGTGFIFPFHFSLHLKWHKLGYWLVGLAGMAMLLLLVSGVIIHRKLFQLFFVFRPGKSFARTNLDLHNLSGVVALPFHFLITLSGLIIFVNIYFAQVPTLIYADNNLSGKNFIEESLGRYSRKPTGNPGKLAPLQPMIEQAVYEWSGDEPVFMRVWHPGDSNAYVELRRSNQHMVRMNLDQIYFDAVTGEVLQRFAAGPVVKAQRFIAGMHFLQFDHWLLRWLYFFAGLLGCVMIVTGLIFWIKARCNHHKVHDLSGISIVQGLTIGSVTGIIIATLAFFVINRVLSHQAFNDLERSAMEVWVFYSVWLATFVHAWSRQAYAWYEQCWLIGGLAILAVVLNATSTGDHLGKTLSKPYWPVAGMDLMLILGGTLAIWIAWTVRRTRVLNNL